MKNTLHTFFYFLVLLAWPVINFAQEGYQLQDPILHIDFGIGSSVRDPNATHHPRYERVKNTCPNDGYYAYTNYTSNCFNNDWFKIDGDHTGNGGNMMLVNASEEGGSFFSYAFFGLKPATKYEFATWLTNVCRINGGCSPLPPDILVVIKTLDGQQVAAFRTGQLSQTHELKWQRYSAFFTTPEVQTSLLLTMSNQTLGGCGNDFAMDDITFRECVLPEVVKTPSTTPPPAEKIPPTTAGKESVRVKDLPPATRAVVPNSSNSVRKPPVVQAKPKPEIKTVKKPAAPAVSTRTDSPVVAAANPSEPRIKLTGQNKTVVTPPAPAILTTRENKLAKTLITAPGTMTIDLYDNGQVDDDTVTIFHNNELLVSRARLSQQPVSFSITVDEQQPHHELVMVANNLGSIPPNTSLMIVKINGKRYDVFISSSEQKNAKVVIDLEKEK